jgi:mono/diheme cytochrome c family protein
MYMKLIAAGVLGGLSVIGLVNSAAAQEFGNARNGAAFAQAICADCHAVKKGQDRSPDPKAPSFERIAATPGMTWTALQAWLVLPHPTMPDLVLGGDDKDNLAAYILSLKGKN